MRTDPTRDFGTIFQIFTNFGNPNYGIEWWPEGTARWRVGWGTVFPCVLRSFFLFAIISANI